MAIEAGGVIFLALGGILGTRGWKMPFLLYLLAWVCLIFVWLFIPHSARIEAEASCESEKRENLLPVFAGAFLAMSIFFIAYLTLPISLASRFRLGPANIGYFMAFISLMAVIFAGAMPRLTKTVPAKVVLTLSFVFLGVGELLFARASTMPWMVLGAVATGAGFGYSIPTANHLVLEMSAPSSRGRDLSYLSIAIFLGQFASSFATILGHSPEDELSRAGNISLGVFAIVGLLAAMRSSVFKKKANHQVDA